MRSRAKPTCNNCGKPKPAGRGRKLCDACSAEWKRKTQRRRCNRCGDPCEARKILCSACLELAEWKRRRRKTATRRKPCTRCGGPKGAGPRRRLCDRCLKQGQEVRPCECCHQRPKRYRTAKLCEVCKLESEARKRERNRLRHHEYRAAKKKKRKRRKKTVSRTRKKNIAENHRMAARLRAERAGREVEPLDERTYAQLYGTGRGQTQERLPVAPLLPMLLEVEDPNRFADAVGLSESFVHRVVSGHYEEIFVPDADRICVGLGVPLELVYGSTA